MINFTPLKKCKPILTFDNRDLSATYFFNTESFTKSKKKTLYCFMCKGQCIKNNEKHHCLLAEKERYVFDELICSCPYYVVTMSIKEPRANNYLFNDFHNLILKLKLRKQFGDYTDWIFENNNVKIITDEDFNEIRQIEEFGLKNLINSKWSFDELINKIDSDPHTAWEQELNWFPAGKYQSTMLETLLNKYREKLINYREGRLLRPFMEQSEIDYERFRESNKIKILEINDYYIINEFWSSYLWPYAVKDHKDIKSINGKHPRYFSFLKTDIDLVISYAQSFSVDNSCYTSNAKLLIDTLQKLK